MEREASQECKAPLYAKVPCFLTGKLVLDTDRERIKQKLAVFLVEEKGYSIGDFQVDREIHFEVKGQKIISVVDLTVNIENKSLMILRGGPGSVVTREAGTVAAARLLEEGYIVPWAVQANLFDASFLDVKSKKAVGYGWQSIPAKTKLLSAVKNWPPPALPKDRIPIEKQILFSYDTHG